jgi:Fe-Mn family superoxide dismutase
MSNNRRDFLKKSALFSLGTMASKLVGNEQVSKLEEFGAMEFLDGGKFSLPALPYAYDALEPFIDKQTMEIHHTKHHQAYVDNLNKALEKPIEGLNSPFTFENIFSVCHKVPALRNNAGGHWNHSFFWQCLSPNPKSDANFPSPTLIRIFEKNFGTFEAFKEQFEKTALSRFGSGWVWLCLNNGKLEICSTANQDNPLMTNAEVSGKPILALDVWEHAYYLKYQNKRADYVKSFWSIVNWSFVQKQF